MSNDSWQVSSIFCAACGHKMVSVHPVVAEYLECSKCHHMNPAPYVDPDSGEVTAHKATTVSNDKKMYKFDCVVASQGYEPPMDGYRSLFGFIWWFWFPRFLHTHPDLYNPRTLRVIWLFFFVELEIWYPASRAYWPLPDPTKPKSK